MIWPIMLRGAEGVLGARGSARRENAKLEIVCGSKRSKQNGKGEHIVNGAPRITSENIRRLGGLKNAIRVFDRNQRRRSGVDHRAPAKKYRKRKKTPHEIAAEKEQKRMEENGWHVEGSEDASDVDDERPQLLIDGYNVLGAMVKQDPRRFRGKELSHQRALLEADVHVLVQYTNVRARILYDAHGNPNPDLTQSIETDCGVETVFCKYYEADTGLWIESKQFIDEGTSSVTVVTSDNEVRGLCSPNAHCQSAKSFIRELKSCKKEYNATLEQNNMMPTGSTLRGALPSQTLSKLDEFRDSLLSNENDSY